MEEDPVEAKKPEGGGAADAALIQRRIGFHHARNPCPSLPNGDFHLETLNSGSDPPRPPGRNRESHAVSAPPLGRRSDGGEVYEHGLDPELSFRITFRKIGAGLENLGNTCFLNSVLQCLTYTEPFAAYLQSGKHTISCQIAGFCAMCALQNHVMIALQSTGKILSPSTLVKNLRCISRNFCNSRQEDAHEYMVNLLESMHKCCLPSGIPSESPSAYEKSLVHKIFGGRLRSQVKCTQCSYSSNKFDPFLDLSLEIVKVDSLWKALKHFTAVEQLDGGERQYQCQNCKEKVRALKQFTIHKAPYVLTIHLKRFDTYVPGQKIDKKVDFEPTLDLKPFISDRHGGDLKYTLYGVLVHAGWSIDSGHYYCYVRTSSGMWHSLDDNQVYQVSEKTVLAQKAYMLFYVRDRSSIVKKSADMVQKDNISTNASGNKLIPQSALVLKGAVLNCLVDGKLSTSESTAAKLETYSVTEHHSSSETDTSSDSPLLEVEYLRRNDDSIRNEDAAPQGNSQLIGREAAFLQANGDILSSILQQKKSTDAESTKESVMPPAKIVQQNSMKDSTQLAQENDNSVPTSTCVNDATATPESDQTNSGRCLLSNGCNREVKSNILISLRNNLACSDSTFQEHFEKILKQTKVHENGDAAIAFHQNDDSLNKKEKDNLAAGKKPLKLLNQSGFIQKVSHDTTPMEYQTADRETERCSTNIQCHGQDFVKLEEPGMVNVLKRSASGFVREEVLEQNVMLNSQTGIKQKKPKHSLNGIFFGRKQLFLSSLSVHKIRKRNRRKKRLLGSTSLHKSVVPGDVSMNDQGTSTSEAVKTVVLSQSSGRKHSHSRFNRNKNSHRRNNSYCNSEPLNTPDRGIMGDNSRDHWARGHPGQSRKCFSSTENQCILIDRDSNDSDLRQRNFMNLLMRGLNQTTVARWDKLESPEFELDGLESSKSSSIGHVLDECDEEYDRGKRKKEKESRKSFVGPNSSQETCDGNSKAKKRRMGSHPFRI